MAMFNLGEIKAWIKLRALGLFSTSSRPMRVRRWRGIKAYTGLAEGRIKMELLVLVLLLTRRLLAMVLMVAMVPVGETNPTGPLVGALRSNVMWFVGILS